MSPDQPLFHHAIPFTQVRYGSIRADPAYSLDTDFLPAFRWLAGKIGFFPHFLSVGCDESAIRRTGYGDQWRVLIGRDVEGETSRRIYRKSGEYPNTVLFSFDDLDGVFMDFMSWHIALNNCAGGRTVSDRETRMILKPSWTRRRWLCAAAGTHAVDLLTPDLPLDAAVRVWVRNRDTRYALVEMGFRNVEVVRLKII